MIMSLFHWGCERPILCLVLGICPESGENRVFYFFLKKINIYIFSVLGIKPKVLSRPGTCYAKIIFSAPEEIILSRALAYSAEHFKVGHSRSEVGQSLGAC